MSRSEFSFNHNFEEFWWGGGRLIRLFMGCALASENDYSGLCSWCSINAPV